MPKKRKAVKIISIVLASLIALGGAAYGVHAYRNNSNNKVNVYSLQQIASGGYWGGMSQMDGNVKAENLQSVYISNTQQLTEVYVSEGDTVKAGDMLAAFDTTLSDLEVERQRINVEKLELDLKTLNSELSKINRLRPYVPPKPAPEPEPEVLDPVSLPYKVSGTGTEASPFIYLWNDECWYTEGFIDGILPKQPETIPDDPGEPDEPIVSDDPETPEDPGDDEQEIPESTNNDTEHYKETSVFAVFEYREYDNPKGDIIKNLGIEFHRNSDGTYKMSFFEPQIDYSKEEPAPVIPDDIDIGSQYTASEISKMKAEKQKEIKNTELQIKVEKVKYDKLQLELNTGIVTAELDGVIKTVADPEEARLNGTPFIVLSAGGGYYISSAVSELDLENIRIGQNVEIQSWMDGSSFSGEIIDISEYPVSSNYYGGNNPNVSYYPVTVEVGDDASLQNGDYVSVNYGSSDSGDGIYIESMFVLYENSKNYVYAMDENEKLEKREIRVGNIYWGSTIEIKGGLTMDDYIAFPYGKNVKDGAHAVVAEISELYESMYY